MHGLHENVTSDLRYVRAGAGGSWKRRAKKIDGMKKEIKNLTAGTCHLSIEGKQSYTGGGAWPKPEPERGLVVNHGNATALL